MDIRNDKSAAPAARDDTYLTPDQTLWLILDGIGFWAAREHFGNPGWLPYIEARGVSVSWAEGLAALAQAQADPQIASTTGIIAAMEIAEAGLHWWPDVEGYHSVTVTPEAEYHEAHLVATSTRPAQYLCEIVRHGVIIGRRRRDLLKPFDLGLARVDRWAERVPPNWETGELGGGWGYLDRDCLDLLDRLNAEAERMRAAGLTFEGVEA
jgi:hypothetical protein